MSPQELPQLSKLQKKLSDIRRAAEERDATRRAKTLNLPYADIRKTPASIEAFRVIPEEDAREAKVAALQLKNRELALAAYNPNLPEAKKAIEDLAGKKYETKIFVVSQSGLEELWHMYEFVGKEKKDITGKVEITKQRLGELLKRLETLEAVQKELGSMDFQKTSTSTLLETFLAGSLATGASDIHFEAQEKFTRVRFRIDGVLHDVIADLPQKNYDALLSRIKLLGQMKINVRGEPQDGRFTITLAGKEAEVRVSIIPSEYGETIVMRILDPSAIQVDLPDLGMRPDDLALVEIELKRPNGLILNTGPTGSGKTTTLYAFLQKLSNPEVKIITIENPIEYRLPGIEQTQVNTEAGYTFAKGLKAIVRQDPDVVLVGEIRDFETADIALQASLTGHMVLSTLHTNDAVGAVPRLVNLGVKTQTVGPALSLVIAQRLVRVLCPKCKKKLTLGVEKKKKLTQFLEELPSRVDRAPYVSMSVFEAGGCEACNKSGYKGRRGIFEFLKGGPQLEQQVLKDSSEVALTALAEQQEMVTMQEDGVLKVLEGVTTFEEVEKVTGPLTMW